MEKNYEAEVIKVRQSQLSPNEKKLKIQDINSEKMAERLSYTCTGRIGLALEPLLKPMGFDWKIGTALIGAFSRKRTFCLSNGNSFCAW